MNALIESPEILDVPAISDAEVTQREAEVPAHRSAATQLVEFATAFTFFHDPQDRPFVRLEIKGQVEVWPVEQKHNVRLWLALCLTRFIRTGPIS